MTENKLEQINLCFHMQSKVKEVIIVYDDAETKNNHENMKKLLFNFEEGNCFDEHCLVWKQIRNENGERHEYPISTGVHVYANLLALLFGNDYAIESSCKSKNLKHLLEDILQTPIDHCKVYDIWFH